MNQKSQQLPQGLRGMPVQDDQQVDNNALYAHIHQLQGDLTSKIDGLSGQISNLRVLVMEGQSAYNAHNLPNRVEAISVRVGALEIANATDHGIPAKVDDHEKRLKTIETTENERQGWEKGRRRLFEALAVVGTLLGCITAAIVIYQWLKGR